MIDTRKAGRALAFLRICVGLLFLVFAEYKLADTKFIWGGGMLSYIRRFVDHACYPFMRPFLERVILPHTAIFGAVVAVTELMIGLSLVTGVLIRSASLGGLAMMLLFLFSADYPGDHPEFWNYFGASLNHSVFLLCFLAFLMAGHDQMWSIRLGRSKR